MERIPLCRMHVRDEGPGESHLLPQLSRRARRREPQRPVCRQNNDLVRCTRINYDNETTRFARVYQSTFPTEYELGRSTQELYDDVANGVRERRRLGTCRGVVSFMVEKKAADGGRPQHSTTRISNPRN